MTERLSFPQVIDLIQPRIAAAAAAMEDGTLSNNLTRDQKRQLTALIDEVEKAWKQGKSIQRKQQTVLGPLMWQAMTGIAPEDLNIGTAEEMVDLMQPGFTPQWGKLLDIAAHSVLGALQLYGHQRMTEAAFLSAVQLPFTSLYIYMSARRFGAPSVFELRDGLAEKLTLTDLNGIKPDDVRPPLPGFYIQMPPGALELWNESTGWHKVSLVGVAEGRSDEGLRQGRVLMVVFWCEPNARSRSPSDDNAQVVFVSLPEGYDGSVEQYEASLDEAKRGAFESKSRKPFVRWDGAELSYQDGFALLRKLIVNFCLYLSSPNPDIEPTGAKQVWKDVVTKVGAVVKAVGPRARRQVTIGKHVALWDVGRKVARLTREMTATDVLVRGHWRHQAHGPARSLRQIMWIEPHVRRPTGGEAAHEYNVKKNAYEPRAPNGEDQWATASYEYPARKSTSKRRTSRRR